MRDVILNAEHGMMQLPQGRCHPGTRVGVAGPDRTGLLVDIAAVRQQEQLERGDLRSRTCVNE